jgi:hypothetical protein
MDGFTLVAAELLRREAAEASSKSAGTRDRKQDRGEQDNAPKFAFQHVNKRGFNEILAEDGSSSGQWSVVAGNDSAQQVNNLKRTSEENHADGGGGKRRSSAKDYAQPAAFKHASNKRSYEEAPAYDGGSKRRSFAQDYSQLAVSKPANKRSYEELPKAAESGGSKRQRIVAAAKDEDEKVPNCDRPASEAKHRGVSAALLVHFVPVHLSMQRLLEFFDQEANIAPQEFTGRQEALQGASSLRLCRAR